MTLRTVLIITLSFHTMVSITRPLITLYASHLGAGTFQIGLLTAAFAFFPLIFAIHAGKISDQMGDRIPILWGSIGCTVGLALPFFSPTMSMLYTSQIIVGMSHLVLAISLQNVLGQVSTKETRDHYFNIFSMFVAMGAFIGPIIGGYLAEHLSYASCFFDCRSFGDRTHCLFLFRSRDTCTKDERGSGLGESVGAAKAASASQSASLQCPGAIFKGYLCGRFPFTRAALWPDCIRDRLDYRDPRVIHDGCAFVSREVNP